MPECYTHTIDDDCFFQYAAMCKCGSNCWRVYVVTYTWC